VLQLLAFAATSAAVIVGFVQSKSFVTRKLRYVEAVHTRRAPWIAGLGAAVVAGLAVALIPVLGAGTAIAFGVSVGFGVAAGAREVRRELPPG
jgi:hypothetical protein